MINNLFGGNSLVYYGYVASTGGLNNEQRICIDDNIFTVEDTVYVCQGETVQLDVTGSPTHTYTWTPATNIDNVNSQTPNVWPSVTTTYTVTYNDYCGNPQTDDVLVIVRPPAQPNLGNDTTICQANQITLDAGTYASYLWSTTATTSQTETYTGAGTYSVTVTNSDGCTGIDDIVVSEHTPPLISAGADASVCAGGTASLTATGTGTYVWNTTETTQSISVSPSVNTTYTVTLTDINTCTNSDDVVVSIGTSLNADAGNNVTICDGESTILTASGGVNYNWNTLDVTQSITVSPSVNTTYTVTVDDGAGCTGTATVNVDVNSSPTVDAGLLQSVCNGENISLTASGATSYIWSTTETTTSINITPSTTSYYYVTGTTGTCSHIDSVLVTLNPTPAIDAGNDATICTGGTASLTASGVGTYLWNTTETTQSINVSPITNTTYTVTLTDANNCSSSDIVVVNVGSSIIASAGNDTSICLGNTVLLTANGGTSYLWNNGETTQIISVSPTVHTSYSVTVSDGTSCTGVDDIDVDVNSLPVIDAGVNQSTCEGSAVILTATGGANYIWSSGLNTATINISPTASQYYYVTGTDINNCSNIDSVLVNINSLPIVNLGNDISICQGGNVSLSVSNSGSYFWSTNETTQSIDVSPTSNTQYSITVTDANNCTASDDINIDVTGSINITTSADTTACIGNNVSLSAYGGVNYQWSTGDNSQSISVATTSSSIYYYVTVDDGSNCSGIDSVLVNSYANPNVDAGTNQQICGGGLVFLNATGANQYIWSNGVTTSNNNVAPTATTTYIVTGTDMNGCSSSDNVTVSVIGDISMTISHSPSIVCPGEQVIITTNIVGGTPPYTIYLDDGTVVSPPLIMIPEQTTVITMTAVSSSCNSSVSATDTIKVLDVPVPTFTSDITDGCVPLSVAFNNTNTETGLSYKWNFGNYGNNISYVKNPVQTYFESGIFDVTLTLTTADNCKSSTTITNMINAFPKPIAKFYADPPVVSVIKTEISFFNLSIDNYNNYWAFGDGDSSLLVNPSHNYNPNYLGDFVVELVVESDRGCKDTVRSIIKVEDVATMYVPTGFTPDNDGINDMFIVKASGVDMDDFSMNIYDRWGEIIYTFNDIYSGWDGKIKGKTVESGVYTWLVVYKDFTGVQYTKSGAVTVIR